MTKAVSTWQRLNTYISQCYGKKEQSNVEKGSGHYLKCMSNQNYSPDILTQKRATFRGLNIQCVSIGQRQCIDSRRVMYILYLQWRAHFTGVEGQSLPKTYMLSDNGQTKKSSPCSHLSCSCFNGIKTI